MKTDFGKYLVIFLFLTATIGFVSGFLVAGSSMITAYNESFEKYNIEDGNFELMEVNCNFIFLLRHFSIHQTYFIHFVSRFKNTEGTV